MRRALAAFAARPMLGRRGIATSFCAALVSMAAAARAERPRIAVEHAGTDAATRRVLAEVRNAGLDPIDVRPGDCSTDLSALADRYKAVAVLSIKRPNRIELAVLSPDTREVIYASTVTSQGGTPASVRAAEELHGRLIDLPQRETVEPAPPSEVESVPPEPIDEPPPPQAPAPNPALDDDLPEFPPAEPFDDVAKDSPPTPKRARSPRGGRDRPALWIGAGAGTESGAFGLDEVPVAQLEARFEPMRYFSVSAFGLLPLTSQTISAPEGRAALSAHVVGAMLRATALDVADVLRVSAGAGGGVAVVSMSGQGSSQRYDGHDVSAVTGVGVATIGMNARLLSWLALRADATAGLAANRPVARFDGRDVASWGPSLVAFTGGFEVDTLELVRSSE